MDPAPRRVATATVLAIVVAVSVAGCGGSTPAAGGGSTTAAGGGTSRGAGPAPDAGRCDAGTVATYRSDESPGAIVPGGTHAKLTPTVPELVALLRQQGIGPSDLVASIMPVSAGPAVICPDGSVYANGERVADTRTNLFTRSADGAIRTVHSGTTDFYLHPVHDVIDAPCPALADVTRVDNKVRYVKAVCLDNLDPIDWQGV